MIYFYGFIVEPCESIADIILYVTDILFVQNGYIFK